MDDVVLGGQNRPDSRTLGHSRRSRPDRGPLGRGRGAGVRSAAIVLATFLIAALCPVIAVEPVAAAGDKPAVEMLPEDFGPQRVNTLGQVVGMDHSGGTEQIAVYQNGNLTPIVPAAGRYINDFTDDGRILVRNGTQLEIISLDGTIQVLPKPVLDGNEVSVFSGFGPDQNGRIIGRIPFRMVERTNTISYQGSTPPQLMTVISTTLAVNKRGVIVGQPDEKYTPGVPLTYSIVRDGVASTMTGLVGDRMIPYSFSDAGHLLYTDGAGGFYIWRDGVSERINDAGLRDSYSVNSEGIVVGTASGFVDNNDSAVIRFADGRIKKISELVDLDTSVWMGLMSGDLITDNCYIVGYGVLDDRWATPRSFLTRLPSCEPVAFDGAFSLSEGGASLGGLKDQDTAVRLRVTNVSGDELTGVTLTDLTAVPVDEETGGEARISLRGAGLPATLAAVGQDSTAFVEVDVHGEEPGRVALRAEVTAVREGRTVNGVIESIFTVRTKDLDINLTVDPPDYEEQEDGTFEPVDITATVSFTNVGDEDLTNIRLQDLDVVRTFSGQQLYVTYKSGVRPDPFDPEILVDHLAPGETSAEFQAIFTATEAGAVDFYALATAKVGENRGATDTKKVRWKARVKKYVAIETEVVSPADGTLLNAGSPVTINGTIENLTTNYEVTLGPLYPVLEGNTGTMTLAYDGPAPNPSYPVPVDGDLVLAPREKRTFQVRFTTNYSEPRTEGANPSGGTRAYATFEPWGEAVEIKAPNDPEPAERVDIRTYDQARSGSGTGIGETPDAQVLASAEDLFKRISIDDSIELPSRELLAIGGGVMIGAAEGVVNAAINVIYSIPDILLMPYSVLVGTYEYQTKIWESFTEQEKEDFLTETSYMIVSILIRNVEFGLQDTNELYDAVYQQAGEFMDETQQDWRTGNYVETTRKYMAFFSEQIGAVAGPILLTHLARSSKAATALERWQTAVNTRMSALFAEAEQIQMVESVLPLLRAIENGVEPTAEVIRKLWGITPEEVAEYQRICKVIGCLATVRSRHASSIQWIEKFKALLKPEALKIKTVSELDVLLGYDVNDLGSLVFKKPDILKALDNPTAAEVKTAASNFVKSKGFREGTPEYTEAIKRMQDRVKEWHKWEKTYKQWDERQWIDVSFNYEGNAIPQRRINPDGSVGDKLTGLDKGKYRGFRLRESTPGSEEFIVEMMDNKTGKWRRITGDIDPVDFTYTDGSPLTARDHARLIQMLQESPLGAEHGYTATFKGVIDPKTGEVLVNPGPEIVKSQFKPNEAALQISPDGPARATRLDVENSRWVSSYDYNMRWVGGFVDAGTQRARGLPADIGATFETVPVNAPTQVALPVRTKPADPTVGRFIILERNEGAVAGLMMGQSGKLQTVNPDGTSQDSPLHDEAFSEGPTVTMSVAPSSELVGPDDPTGPDPAPIRGGGGSAGTPGKQVGLAASISGLSRGVAMRAQAPLVSLSAGSTMIRVSQVPGMAAGANGFAVGQTIAIGVGSPNVELVLITSINEGIITLASPLSADHEPGEVVMMVVTAGGVPIDPTLGVDAQGGTDTGPGSGNGGAGTGAGTTNDGTGAGSTMTTGSSGNGSTAGSVDQTGRSDSTRPTGRLAYTGAHVWNLMVIGLALVIVGFAAAGTGLVPLANSNRRRRKV